MAGIYNKEKIGEIIGLRKAGMQSVTRIATEIRCDRKTVQK